MAMRLKFIEQQYQTDAVNQVVDFFDGSERKDELFTIVKADDNASLLFDELGYKNKCTISEERMVTNLQTLQERRNIKKDDCLSKGAYGCPNLTVEMETGTGKTYVYTKTILELNKRYGFTKFIIVVPSVAIKEGVFKSFEVTHDHFRIAYDNVPYDYFTYDSSKIGKIKTFAQSQTIQIMIMTIGAFNKTVESQDKEDKANLIFRPSEKLDGWRGIDLITATAPIVIVDEPQSVDNTPKAKAAIKQLNPLAILRYSATHKESYNLVYRLSPVDAYQQHLVKEIYVGSVAEDEGSTRGFVRVIDVTSQGTASTNRARIEIFVKGKDGSISKKVVTAKTGDDIWELSGEVDYYEGGSFIISSINADPENPCVYLDTGDEIMKGSAIGEVDDEAMKRSQIRATIEAHLDKERSFTNKGIKVLSLFFIDEVANYRGEDGQSKGKYAKWFEEEFLSLIRQPKYKTLRENPKLPTGYFDVACIHDGYFSTDKKGRAVNTNGDSASDDTTYNLIMKEKEKLLSFSTPIRFIFSHSALREGWDNPNVFQVCTLIETKDVFTKRQKIGRGLRLCVNQNGERILDTNYNYLTVVASESYKEFCTTLQKEYRDSGYKFGVVEPTAFTGSQITTPAGKVKTLTQDDSVKIHKALEKKGYLDSKGNLTEKYKADKDAGVLDIPAEFRDFRHVIVETLKRIGEAGMPKNAKERVKVNRNEKVINSEVFAAIWKRINQRTIYSIHMDIGALKAKATEYIRDMPPIKEIKIRWINGKVVIDESGVRAEGIANREMADPSEFGTKAYPDFIKRISEATQLLRQTIIDILVDSGRLSDFYKNPEDFIKQVSARITKAKKEHLIDGLQYTRVEEFFRQEDIFDDTELYGIKNSNVVDVSAPDKNPFDHIIFESSIERTFAEDCDADDEVLLYAKLPSSFKVDTPFGPYNPDWMVVVKPQSEDYRLYFVAETKGNEDIDALKPDEKRKILCGKLHFEELNKDIKYEVVKTLLSLKGRYIS